MGADAECGRRVRPHQHLLEESPHGAGIHRSVDYGSTTDQ